MRKTCDDHAMRRRGAFEKLSFLSSRKGRDVHRAVIEQQRPNLLQLLELFPSCKVGKARYCVRNPGGALRNIAEEKESSYLNGSAP